MNHAGINIGRGHTKVKTDHGYWQIASIAKPTIHGFNHQLGLKNQTHMTWHQGRGYELGEQAALTLGGDVSKHFYEEWADSQTYRVLKQAVLDRLAREAGGEWKVVLCVPVEEYRNRDYTQALKKLWEGSHQTLHGEIMIQVAKVIPEPMGAFWAHAGLAVDPVKVERSRVSVIDFGYFTTCWLTVNQMHLDKSQTGSANQGVAKVLERVQQAARQQFKKKLDLVEIEMAILGIWEAPQGMEETLPGLLTQAKGQVADDLAAILHTAMPRAGHEIWLAGGGAKIFEEEMRRSFSGHAITVIEDPQSAIAIGCWVVACESEGVVA